MSADTTANYYKRLSDNAQSRKAVYAVCVDSQNPDAEGGVAANLAAIADAAQMSPLFESLGAHAGGVACAWASAIEEYCNTYGAMPSDVVFGSAVKSLQNITMFDGASGNAFLDSVQASVATTDGIEFRAKQAGMILPVMLGQATMDAVTWIPGAANEVEIFELRRIAGATFGDYVAGDELGPNSFGQYASMEQVYPFAAGEQPDGTKKTFNYDSSVHGFAVKVPFKRGTVKIMANRKVVATEQSGGQLFGVAVINGTTYNINGTVTPATGVVAVTTTTALPVGVTLLVNYDVDIEKAPELIPTITHDMTSWKIKPHENVLAAEHTIQAYWMMQREHGIDLDSFQMTQARNYLAYDQDLRNLRKMILAAETRSSFDLEVPAGQYFKEHYELINKALLEISQQLLESTKVGGLVGLFAGTSASAVFKAMGAPLMEMAPNYKQVNRIHYVGKLFGQWAVYEVPNAITVIKGDPTTTLGAWDCLCYARGESHVEAGIVVGPAVPATMYSHATSKGLVDRKTLWELSYCDIHPHDGGRYYHIFTLNPAA